MVSWTVEIGGVALDAVMEVSTGSESGGTLGTARVVCANTSANRAVDFSDAAVVKREGTVEFEGPVTKKPTLGTSNGRIEFTVADQRYELSLIEAHRPFYQKDPGEIIRSAVNKQARIKSPVRVHSGDDASDWSSTAAEAGLVGATEQRLHEYGDDVFALGIPNGSSGLYEATYEAVPGAAIPGDGQVVRLTTRLMANNQADVFEGELDLRDNAGNNYIWSFPRLDTNFTEYEFSAEDAVAESSIGTPSTQDGTLTYRFRAKGKMPENRAIAIDHAEVLPYEVRSRNSRVDTSGVEDVGDTINRRHDETVLELVTKYATEYGYTSWVDQQDVLRFEPAGSESSPLAIDYSGTPVIDANFDRDSDRVTNKITVQGSDGVQVTAVDSSSVSFYGLSEREDQLVDEQIQSQEEARRRAEGFLEDNAWSDTAISFTIADTTYGQVRVGQAITLRWPPEDISTSTWEVSSVNANTGGTVEIALTGAT